MDRVSFGQTGLSVSRLGLAGSYGIDAASIERAYHELGVNFFFLTRRMAPLVEALRSLIRAGHRDRLVICSGANIPLGSSVTREHEAIAKALGTDHLDLFLLFWVQARWYVTGKTWPAMRALKQAGKARAVGISIHDRPMARRLVDELALDALMIRYNAAHRGAEREIFETLGPGRPGIIAYTATRWGRLLQPAGELGPMSAGECYRFALGHPKVDLVLSGPKTYAELEENAAAVAQGALAPERLEEVRRFGDAVRGAATGRFGFAGA
jgi:aryl-alcohol dehydrogenase-like predicted oxidoreductase